MPPMKPPRGRAPAPPATRRRRDARAGYGFISPVLLGLLLWTALPMVLSFCYSFTRYDLPHRPSFTGLSNYRLIFTDPQFWNALKVTVVYAVISVPLGLAVGLGIAVLLNQNVPGMRVFRTLLYLPSILPLVAGAVVFNVLLSPSKFGVVNSVLMNLHLIGKPIQFFTSPSTALPSLILFSLWGAGGSMLIWLAGLRSVPAELLDAAKVDGAGAWTRFWRITLPMITPTILFNAVISIINAMQIFTQAVVIDAAANATPGATTGLTDAYNGSPLGALDFLNVFIYRHTFGYLQFGVGSAAAWALFLLTLVVTLLFFRSSRRWVFYQGGER